MKMQTLILMLTFISFVFSDSLERIKLGIDLELGENKVFQIRSIDEEPIGCVFHPVVGKSQIPRRYLDLIGETLIRNNFYCHHSFTYGGFKYYRCNEDKNADFSKIKLHLRLENSTLTLTEKELFEVRGTTHIMNFIALAQIDANGFIFEIKK